jgi:hypothetical protein
MAAGLRRHLFAGLGCLALLPAGPAAASGQGLIEADRVIAAFLLRFAQFVEWPETAQVGRDDFEICVAEPDPFGPHLDQIVADEQVGGRRITSRRVDGPRAIAGCHVLYVTAETPRAAALLEAAADQPVLTVGESPDFLDRGGVIKLLVGPRIRFEVDAGAAARAGLALSSQLLNLAVSVRGAQ